MSFGRNLSRARSHLIFIAGLLFASSFVLWVERSEEAPLNVGGQVGLGTFPNAEAAGRHWDRIRRDLPAGERPRIVLNPVGDNVELRAEVKDIEQICRAAANLGSKCER